MAIRSTRHAVHRADELPRTVIVVRAENYVNRKFNRVSKIRLDRPTWLVVVVNYSGVGQGPQLFVCCPEGQN